VSATTRSFRATTSPHAVLKLVVISFGCFYFFLNPSPHSVFSALTAYCDRSRGKIKDDAAIVGKALPVRKCISMALNHSGEHLDL